MQRSLLILLLLCSFLLGAAAFWLARQSWTGYERRQPETGVWRAGPPAREGTLLSLDEILERLEVPGSSRILEVERERRAGRLFYEIELLLPDGRVEELLVDPRTGRVVRREYEEEED